MRLSRPIIIALVVNELRGVAVVLSLLAANGWHLPNVAAMLPH